MAAGEYIPCRFSHGSMRVGVPVIGAVASGIDVIKLNVGA
jgi:hypothetical protein